jgi:hypothetical protein
MYLLTVLGMMLFSQFSAYADEGDEVISPSEEIASADAEVPVDEDCGCGGKKKKP